MKEEYKSICSEADCYKKVDELDIERGTKGQIYERSKKCLECRTPLDRKAIKRFRKETRKKFLTPNNQ